MNNQLRRLADSESPNTSDPIGSPATANQAVRRRPAHSLTGHRSVLGSPWRTKLTGAGVAVVLVAAGGVAISEMASAVSTAAGAGSAALGSTSYAVPSSALWVAASGSNSGKGTSSSPLKTIQRAIDVAKSGRTIVVKSGTYHESLSIPSNKSLTIQSAPRSVVWVDGAETVSGWTKSGSTWIHSGWKAKFDSTPSYTGHTSSAKAWGFINSAHPMASHPDQVWIDGKALTQVSSKAKVKAGTFYSDYAGKRIVIGSSPSGHNVAASSLGIAASIKGKGSVVRGIGFRRFATAVQDMGSVRITGSNVTLENDVITQSATTALSDLSTGASIRHLTLDDNGMLGMHANYADNVTVDGVISDNNNLEGFNTAPVAGGIKMSRTRNIVIKNSILSDNAGSGLWLDESSYNATVVNNIIVNNAKHGFSFEIGATGVIADNVITGSGSDGLKINNTSNVRIWNNTLGGNAKNIELLQDVRKYLNRGTAGHDPRQKFPDKTMTWKISNIQIENNVLQKPASTWNINIRDYTKARSAAKMGIVIDGNLFAAAKTLVVWQGSGSKLSMLKTVAQIAGVGAGSHNAQTSSGQATPNISSANARPLPADIAKLVGQKAGTRKVGAF